MRNPDSRTYEFGHWETMQLSIGLSHCADNLKASFEVLEGYPLQVAVNQHKAILDLQHLFNTGTITLTVKD